MMRIKEEDIMNVGRISTHFENVAVQIQQVKTTCAGKKDVAPEIKKLLTVVEACNQTLDKTKVTVDKETANSAKRLNSILQSLQIIMNDKSIQEKVNALQTGLLSAFRKELKKLERNLKDDKWKRVVKASKAEAAQDDHEEKEK